MRYGQTWEKKFILCLMLFVHVISSVMSNMTQTYLLLSCVFIQGIHSDCHRSSPCHLPHYEPSKVIVEDPAAVQKLTKCLKETNIFRHAESFCRVSVVTEKVFYMHLLCVYTYVHAMMRCYFDSFV